ncbi:LppA family lipoprotein [Amycolatopsis sp.]|jgi:hypothetical protein|uniref:LppA family lipoprotein n=1 Tax=Amycolatopsis sp. TaxID=37632 RepID=UPI002DFB7E16|nr:LppA family lipoprotein [Amycolatopsis sp.]
MKRRFTIPAALCALTLLLGGCTSEDPKGDAVNNQFAELMKRPDIEQVEAEYQNMLASIREKLVNEIGIAPWIPKDSQPSASACGGEFTEITTEGQRRNYSSGRSPGNLPDGQWSRAVALVGETAGQHGFGAPEIIVDRPGDHEAVYKSTTGAELIFGTGTNTTLSVTTGCHLTAEAHKRGTPAAKEPLY